MTTVVIEIPDSRAKELSTYARKIGGRVKVKSVKNKEFDLQDDVTHETFFGENIRRVIRAFKS